MVLPVLRSLTPVLRQTDRRKRRERRKPECVMRPNLTTVFLSFFFLIASSILCVFFVYLLKKGLYFTWHSLQSWYFHFGSEGRAGVLIVFL